MPFLKGQMLPKVMPKFVVVVMLCFFFFFLYYYIILDYRDVACHCRLPAHEEEKAG